MPWVPWTTHDFVDKSNSTQLDGGGGGQCIGLIEHCDRKPAEQQSLLMASHLAPLLR
jgi:hypothetical protein